MADFVLSLVRESSPVQIIFFLGMIGFGLVCVIMIVGDINAFIRERSFRSWLAKDGNYARFTTREEAEKAYGNEGSAREYARLVWRMRRR